MLLLLKKWRRPADAVSFGDAPPWGRPLTAPGTPRPRHSADYRSGRAQNKALRPADHPAAARHVGRDVKAVLGDVHARLDAGLLDKAAKNQVAFPFDAIRVEFTLRAA